LYSNQNQIAMQSKKIAQAVKDYLVNLAIEDRLPMDLTQLDVTEIQKAVESAMPSARDKAISQAEHYLCDSDELTIEQQIEAIENHEDQNDLIDNVEGVIVWDKVEYSFTCEDFLSEIGWNRI
jgi:hypothetical protein